MKDKNKSIIISLLIFLLVLFSLAFSIHYSLLENNNDDTSEQDYIIQEKLENLLSPAPTNIEDEPTSNTESVTAAKHQNNKSDSYIKDVSYVNTEQSTQDQNNLICLGTFEATAYANDTITSTGSVPIVGQTIAVDPSIIPYGTTVYIEAGNYSGYYIAEDCGGAIRGNIIDIYMSSEEECVDWGRRFVKVYIVN